MTDSSACYQQSFRQIGMYMENRKRIDDKKKTIEIFCEETGYTQKIAEAYLAEAIGITKYLFFFTLNITCAQKRTYGKRLTVSRMRFKEVHNE